MRGRTVWGCGVGGGGWERGDTSAGINACCDQYKKEESGSAGGTNAKLLHTTLRPER